MKRILIVMAFCLSIFACSTAENTNVGNPNGNYNQNLELQKIRNQLKQQSSNHQREINAVQNQIEQGTSNSKNLNKIVETKHENSHEITPESR